MPEAYWENLLFTSSLAVVITAVIFAIVEPALSLLLVKEAYLAPWAFWGRHEMSMVILPYAAPLALVHIVWVLRKYVYERRRRSEAALEDMLRGLECDDWDKQE